MSKDQKVPLLRKYDYGEEEEHKSEKVYGDDDETTIIKKGWVESKKLWHVVGPSIISRLCSYTMLVVTQSFAGHLGDLELAAVSIGCNVIVGLDFGLLGWKWVGLDSDYTYSDFAPDNSRTFVFSSPPLEVGLCILQVCPDSDSRISNGVGCRVGLLSNSIIMILY